MSKSVVLLLLLLPACCLGSKLPRHGSGWSRDTPPEIVAGRLIRDVLVLSGGSQNGAYGAGVLNAWSARGDLPTWDVVTGVSTGALLATHAFLGEVETLRDVYTSVSFDDILETRGILGLVLGESYFDTAPLERLIARTVTMETLERVAARHREGRRLYVASVSLTSGMTHVWDLGALAASDDPSRLDRYRRVLLASSTQPVLFNPVTIDGEIHVDGGIREPLFLRDAAVVACENCVVPPSIYVVVNGKLVVERAEITTCPDEVGFRALELLLDQVRLGSLREVRRLATERGASFHVTAIPPDLEIGDSNAFDPEVIARIYEAGVEFGLSWDASF